MSDLRFRDERPTDAERAAVDRVLGSPSGTWDGGDRHLDDLRRWAGPALGRDLLLPALHALADRVGWISPGGLDYVCRRLQVAPAEAYGVATFYALFWTEPRPPRVVHVCVDGSCQARGADAMVQELTTTVGHPRRMVGAGGACWQPSPCLGLCEQAPAALVLDAGDPPADRVLGRADLATIVGALHEDAPADAAPLDATPAAVPPAAVPQAGEDGLVLLARVGRVDPERLDDYRAQGGYRALPRAIEVGSQGVIDALVASGLSGRGGAGFPTGRKWSAVAAHADGPHELVCNADESEPGTFKDRVVMESDPFALVEAMTIAGLTIGAPVGRIYLRGEYRIAERRLVSAIAQARAAGLLGPDVAGTGRSFELEIRRGAGAYICGEETAIFNSIEGHRGEPRAKPPFPTDVGLFGRPTVVNNVETLVNVLPILVDGVDAFRSRGTAGSPGTKLFCVSGSVEHPGLYELPFGVTLRDLIARAGGVLGGRPLGSVLLGGAAGTFATVDELDVELSSEGTRAAGLTVGSGAVVVLDDTVEIVDVVRRLAAFFRDESCGQCVPCRVGTVRQEEALARLAAPGGATRLDDERALLDDLAQVMRDASICGLGHTAANAVQSALVKLRPFGGREVQS